MHTCVCVRTRAYKLKITSQLLLALCDAADRKCSIKWKRHDPELSLLPSFPLTTQAQAQQQQTRMPWQINAKYICMYVGNFLRQCISMYMETPTHTAKCILLTAR